MESSNLSASREDDTVLFGKLPIDLVLRISDFLPIESLVAFALATKPLYYSLALRNVWKSDIRLCPSRCAQLIARYTPKQVYCAFCKRLHPRRTTPKITKNWSSLSPCSSRSSRLVWLHLDPWDYHLQFEDVYNVMMRYRWGAPYGDDLESLAVDTDWHALTYDPSRENPNHYLNTQARYLVKLTVKPEIVCNKLILRTIQHIWYDRNVWDDSTRSVLGYPLITCQHARLLAFHPQNEHVLSVPCVPQKRARSTRSRRQEQQKVSTRTELHPPSDCTKCLSRHFFVLWDHREAGIVIGLYTWTDLGACDFNLTPQWMLATDDDSRTYQNIWPSINGRKALDQAFETHEQITGADSELYHESFERAKHNLALRNQRLRTLKLCSEDQNTAVTSDAGRCQAKHQEKDLPKNRSRVSRFIGQILRAVRPSSRHKKS